MQSALALGACRAVACSRRGRRGRISVYFQIHVTYLVHLRIYRVTPQQDSRAPTSATLRNASAVQNPSCVGPINLSARVCVRPASELRMPRSPSPKELLTLIRWQPPAAPPPPSPLSFLPSPPCPSSPSLQSPIHPPVPSFHLLTHRPPIHLLSLAFLLLLSPSTSPLASLQASYLLHLSLLSQSLSRLHS